MTRIDDPIRPTNDDVHPANAPAAHVTDATGTVPSPTVVPLPPQRWNVFAVVGFVCAFLLPPVGFACSIVAFVQTKDGRARGRVLAAAGIVVAVLMALVWFAVIGYLVWFAAMFVPYGAFLRAQ